MTLLEILTQHQSVTLGIHNDIFYTTVEGITIDAIKDNKEIRLLTDNTFLTLYISKLDFVYDDSRNEYTGQHKDTTFFICPLV